MSDLTCPYCARPMQARLGIGNGPRPDAAGAFSVCADCTGLSVIEYGPFGDLIRTPTAAERAQALARDDLALLMTALIGMHEERRESGQ